MSRIDIDALDVAGVAALLDLAAAEGWNPGIDDAAAFHAADPEGFLALRVDGRFVAGISIVRQGASHGFLGLYIAAPAMRGRGHGIRLWREALARARARGLSDIGLDGVVERQADYRASGFVLAHRNLRFAGRPVPPGIEPTGAGVTIRSVAASDAPALADLDASVGGVRRERFCRVWLGDEGASRTTLVAVPAGTDGSGADEAASPVSGFGTIRRCRSGHKIGPLVAGRADVAAALVEALARTADAREIVLDVPEPNAAAMALAGDAGLAPVFETARMYLGRAPRIDTGRLYGVATFELG